MKKFFTIKNKLCQKIVGVIEWHGKTKGPLVILCHGFKGFMDQTQIKGVAEYLVKTGYTTVRFDATNSIGKSDGKLLDFTVGGYLNDLKAVVIYALKIIKRKGYALFGFSIGAMVSYLLASKYKKVRCLVLQGPTYSLKYALHKKEYNFPQWQKNGWITVHSNSKNRDYKVGFNYYKEGIKYNTKKAIKQVSCPTAIIYGTKEGNDKKKLFNHLYRDLKVRHKGKFVIQVAPHTLRKVKHIKQASKLAIGWLNKYFNL